MASRLQDVILRGLAADKPVATDVAPGTLYYSSDSEITERCADDGLTWESYTDASSGGAHAPSHASGGTDPVTLAQSQITNLTADLALKANLTDPRFTRTGAIGMIIDGGTSVIATGLKGYLEVPFACTIQAVTLLADVSGSIVIDIWKDIYANYPPVVADTIVAAAKPTITTALKSQNTTLTGWTTSIVAGDILGFNVDSVTSIKKVTLSLKVQFV